MGKGCSGRAQLQVLPPKESAASWAPSLQSFIHSQRGWTVSRLRPKALESDISAPHPTLVPPLGAHLRLQLTSFFPFLFPSGETGLCSRSRSSPTSRLGQDPHPLGQDKAKFPQEGSQWRTPPGEAGSPGHPSGPLVSVAWAVLVASPPPLPASVSPLPAPPTRE